MSAEFDALAVVVVSYGSHDLLARLLVPVGASLPGAQVVVVDNWTTAHERERIGRLALEHGWTLLTPEQNTGFGVGCNLGAAAAIAAGRREILLLNPDATVDADSVRALRAALSANPRSVVAPRILDAQGRVWSAGMDIDLDTGNTRPWRRRAEFPEARTLAWFTGACLLLHADLWAELDGFDEDYFLYWEDVDLSVRAERLGAALTLVDSAVARHDVGATQRSGTSSGKSPVYYYFNIRNRSLFARKNLDRADRRGWHRTRVPAAWTILRRGGRRQFLRPWPILDAFWRGLRDSDYGLTD